MRCPSCDFEISANQRFCGRCGIRFELRCSECGRSWPVENRYCGDCGKPLAAGDLTRAPGSRKGDGERRQLTILFCDIVGSVELAARMDAEELQEVMGAFRASASAVVARYAGHVAQHLGDGLLAYFGWPQAQGDDAERAVRAALELIDPATPRDPRIQLRVGVHTGPVVLAEVSVAGHTEMLAHGEAPGVASRVQGAAHPGEVLITGATLRLVPGLFQIEERGRQMLRGFPQPFELIRVARALGQRLHAWQNATPFVGREEERRVLSERLHLAASGEGQVVLIVGEPGIGKSRLAKMLRDEHASLSLTWFEAAASAHDANTPLFVVSEVLRLAFGGAEVAADERLARLARGLEANGLHAPETVALLAPLIGIAPPRAAGQPQVPPEAIHQGQLEALEQWLLAIARVQPLVLLLEDVQWADPSTIELMTRLVECAAHTPLLVLLTARPEFRAPWPLRAHHTQLTLNRFGERRARELIDEVASGRSLTPEVVDAVAQRADGVPIFVEELTKAALEVGARAAREIPDTLAGSLMARLDRLGASAREAALVAAVIGREFPRALLHAVHPIPEPELDRALAKLVDAELAFARGAGAELTYIFNHALVAEAAYGALLRARRRELHARVASTLLAKFPELAAARPDTLAHHLSEAGDLEAAVDAWTRAGELALRRGAGGEALRHLARALEKIGALPESGARDARELRAQIARSQALIFARGPATPEASAALDRATELGARVGDPAQQVLVLFSLFSMASSREGGAAALPIAERMLGAAQRAGAQPLEVWAQFARGMCLYFAGTMQGAYDAFTRAIDLHDDANAVRVPIDPLVAVLPYRALAAWYLGRADEARALASRAIERAEHVGRPAERAWAGSFVGLLYFYLREPALTRERADAVLAACREEPNPMQESMAKSLRGVAQALEGDVAAGLPLVRAGVAQFRSIGERISLESTLGTLVDTLTLAGEYDEALAVLDEAQGVVTGDQLHRAESLRRRADLLLCARASDAEVEAAYREAIAWASRQGNLALELRASLGCARFWHERGRSREARALLAPVVERFAEGFDARDLREAGELLARL